MTDAADGLESKQAAQADAAAYVAAMTGGLRELARGNDLHTLAYLLDMARLEAEETARLGEEASRSNPIGGRS